MSDTGHNRLAALAADIRALDAQVRRNAEQVARDAIEAGHRLIEAKDMLVHGEWQQWLAENTGLSVRSAQRYMRLARLGVKSDTVSHLGLRGALDSIAQHQWTKALAKELTDAGITDRQTIERTAYMRSLGCRGIYGPMGATFPDDLTRDEWAHIGRVLGSMITPEMQEMMRGNRRGSRRRAAPKADPS